MKLTYKPYTLELKHKFTLANSSRSTTPVMLTELEYEGITGYGEASMPPYLGESHQTVSDFLSKLDLSIFNNPLEIDSILDYVDTIEEGNFAAKASIDIALHDLVGKLENISLYNLWKLDKNKTPETSFTIGIDTKEIIIKKVQEAENYKILKVKLGSTNDKGIINTIRSVTNKPIIVDVNQGWEDKYFALEMAHWLSEKNVKLIEQPFSKSLIDETAWLNQESPIPIFADESAVRFIDLKNIVGCYSGINIKLMKCTGLAEAKKMIDYAKSSNLQIMLGCMTETSCAISAAAQLSPMVEWADLDGNLLINNDPFVGTQIIDGKISLSDKPGIGVSKRRNLDDKKK